MSLKKITEKLSYVVLRSKMNKGIRLVDTMPRMVEHDSIGLDSAVVQAARVSYGKGTKKVNDDKNLISYLMQHKHTTPFEMVEFKFHVKAPIFITRQWMRHRTGTFNEISGRYSELKSEWYIPDVVREQSVHNKQGSGMPIVSSYWEEYMDGCAIQNDCYNNLIKEGVSKEISRIGLPQNMYTEFYWKVNLHNLLHFLKLRSHPSAQLEIREYADEIKNIIQPLCPTTVEAFDEHVTNSITLSGSEVNAIRKMKIFKGTTRQVEEYKNKLDFLRL